MTDALRSKMHLERCSLLLALACLAHGATPPPTVLLKNAAQAGVLMPVMGLGTGAYGSDPRTPRPECWSVSACPGVAYNATLAFLATAAAGGAGANVRIDAANNYNDQAAIGAAIAASGLPRASVFVTTKVGDNYPLGYDEVTAQFAAALTAMNVSYVDLALIHWPQNKAPSSDPACNANGGAGNATCRLNSWRALVDVFNAGRARAIGVSNYNSSELQEIVDAGLPVPALNQIPLNIYRSSTQAATALTCARWGIALNAYSPLGVPDWHAFPTGATGMSATTLADPVVAGIARAHNRTAAAVMINWLWFGLGAVTNPRTRDPAHMAENLFVSYDFRLTDGEVNALSSRPQSWCSVDNWYECAPDA